MLVSAVVEIFVFVILVIEGVVSSIVNSVIPVVLTVVVGCVGNGVPVTVLLVEVKFVIVSMVVRVKIFVVTLLCVMVSAVV